jgi:hypothetical protein
LHSTWRAALVPLLAVALVAAGMGLRISWTGQSALWCDEAESSINALTILQTGLPGWKYLGLPVYENTLSEPWEKHPEYEFRDSTYSLKGVVVYHGWLPLYAIAASQALFGMRPDLPVSPPRVLHGPQEVPRRTVIPRLPALVFSLLCMAVIYRLGTQLGGPVAGLGALALMALNARTVDFGLQARYYSLTLLMNGVAAWCLWQAARRGRWRDFFWLGLASAGLFHTHLFSFLAFGAAAAAASPAIMRRPAWLPKSLAGAGPALILVLPWLWFSGFLTTASAVPKVFKLFDSKADAFFYLLDRPLPLVLLLVLVGMLAVAWLRPAWLPARLAAPLREHGVVYALLIWWMVVAYAAFHLIIPAASFFFERLSLVLWTPFVLLMGLFLADLLRGLRVRGAPVVAVVLMVGMLAARGRLALFEETSINSRRPAVAALVEALETMDFTAGTKIYATPNEHLTITYYTGLPVQSVAPVRRAFLEAHPGPVVYIELQFDALFPREETLLAALDEAGWEPAPAIQWYAQAEVWKALAAADLRRRGIRPPEPGPLDPAIGALVEITAADYEHYRGEYLKGLRSSPVLRGIPARDIKDIWMGFFYRFVEPESRIGTNLNIIPRLRTSRIEFLPEARAVIYWSPPPAQGFFIWPARPNEKAFEISDGRFQIEPDVCLRGGFK